MQIKDILSLSHTCCNMPGVSKKRVLEFIAEFFAARNPRPPDPEKPPVAVAEELYEHLLGRERLGSTGLGHGIAIPHCRLASCQAITGMLFKLSEPVDFDATDREPVDLVFALVVPEEESDAHLQALSAIAALLQDPACRQRLRQATTDESLFAAAIEVGS